MVIGDLTVNDTFEVRDRNKEIKITSPLGADTNVIIGMTEDDPPVPIVITVPNPNINVHREVVLLKDGVKVFVQGHSKEYHVNKNLSEIISETVTLPAELGGITLSAGQIAAAMELLTDKFAETSIGSGEYHGSIGSGEYVV